MQSQTNGIRNLIMREYFNLPIPLPPLDVQQQIAAHINKLKTQIAQLEQEIQELTTTVKIEIENDIFTKKT